MIKTTTLLIGAAMLNISASPMPTTQDGVPAKLKSPIASFGVQIAHMDVSAEASGFKTEIAETSDFAVHIELRNGHVINVRF